MSGWAGAGRWTEATLVSPCPHRQLEAIVRIAEALSKMKLQPFATEADVEEALRLFQVSTLEAALSGTLSGEHTRGLGPGAPRAGRHAASLPLSSGVRSGFSADP